MNQEEKQNVPWWGHVLALAFVVFVVFGIVVGVRGCRDREDAQAARRAELAAEEARPMIGSTVQVQQAMPAFVKEDNVGRMIKLATRDSESATAFLQREQTAGRAFILERGAWVKVLDADGFLEPHYQVRDARGRVGWVHCVAFED